MQYGAFVISLDFELLWGVRDKRTIADYGANIRGVRDVVPALLDLFAEREIACTWATVGLLFFAADKALLASLPARKPCYANPRVSSYHYLGEVGTDEEHDHYYYGLSLIRRILAYPAQEIGTHTFSHFYCLEEGGDTEAFRADLEAAQGAAAGLGVELASIVFPRNQVSAAHLSVCREFGLRAFRGNERVWFHRARRDGEQTLLVRGARLADSYLPIGGAHDHEPALVDGLVDIPASRFLRPVAAECRAGAAAPAAHHLGDGNGGAPPKAVSPVVAPAQFRRRFAREFGVPARHPRSFPHAAAALRHAVNDDGGGRRRGFACAWTG